MRATEATPRIRPVPLRLGIDALSADEIERIHGATLEVLRRTGLHVRSERLVKELGRAGADIDPDELRVRLPSDVVEEAVARAPSSYTLAGRDPACDVVLDRTNGHLALDGCASDIVDLDTGERRASTKADLLAATRMADAVPEITIMWQPVAARDSPTATQPLHEMHAQLTSTSKHIQQMTAIDPVNARGVVEMARVVAGGDEALRRRPILSAFQCTLSPLTIDEGPLEAALVYAEAGVPCGWVSMPLSTATAPTTPAGSVVLTNAELLGAIATVQLLAPGAPTFYGVCTSTTDLSSGSIACGWGPEENLFSFACGQLARRYRIPSELGAFGTGAKTQDWQAGAQHMLSSLVSYLSGADMLCASGTIYAGRVFAFEQVVLDSEIVDIIHRLEEGMSLSDEDLAVDVIDQVGPGGHFLGQAHTLRNMRRNWQSRYFDRGTWEEWEAAGRPSPRDRANERVRQILAEHEPQPLEEGVEQELRRIIDVHEDEAEGAHHG
jgi:trimethylamine--corrinoid protein Co-methyltransferase